jgi:hypothetical protein
MLCRVATLANAAIGKVACPIKGCDQTDCCVYRFKERGEGTLSVANRRFAGKVYMRCSEHGRLGGDASDQKMQDYILSNAQMAGPGAGESPAKPAKTPARAPAKKNPSPVGKRSGEGEGWPWE